jgi:hypothetical protein
VIGCKQANYLVQERLLLTHPRMRLSVWARVVVVEEIAVIGHCAVIGHSSSVSSHKS